MENNLITIKNLYKTFGGAVALNGMNFTINKGEIRCLIGENGCGKSTMIKIISGFYSFDQGEIYINGKQYKKITPIEAMNEGIQVIYQDFSLFDNMTIAENIMMYDSVKRNKKLVNQKELYKRAEQILDKIRFNIDLNKYVYELNVAQKQMVAICRALVLDAKLLIMDEPTSALTTKEVENLFTVVKTLKEKGVSILFVSHKMDEVFKISDSITVMRNGSNVFESNDMKLSKDELTYYITGKKISEESYQYTPTEKIKLLEVKNYTLLPYFKNISFSLYKGEILGITGLLGSGRSELADSLFGILPAEHGSVVMNGKDLGLIRNVSHALENSIGYVPEDRLTEGIHLEQTIADNSIASILGSLTNSLGLLSKKKIREEQMSGLSRININGMIPYNPAKSLSGGNQQKLVLIKWLATKPKLLILNCPTVGVDIGAKNEIHNIIKNLAREGIGVIVISDDIPEIMKICNRVIIMKDGIIANEKNIADTTLEEIEDSLGSILSKKEVAQ